MPQNKSLSDDTDELLRLQGIGWVKRKIIARMTLTLYVKHYKVGAEHKRVSRQANVWAFQDDEGNEHIDIEQVGSGGFGGNKEQRLLTWQERPVEDPVFGPVGTYP